MAHKYFDTVSHAAIYSKFRPKTPDALVQRIVAYVSEKIPGPLEVAVDVGCGSGQSTEALAPYFSKVLGVDASETAINEANKKVKISNVTYGTSAAEKLNFQDNSVTLVTAGQACHWFNLPAFYEEVKRILIPGGTLALYGYQLPRPMYRGPTAKDLSPIIDKFYGDTLGSYVQQGSRECYIGMYSNEKYQIPLATRPLQRDDSVYLEQKGTLADLIGYVSSWSAFQYYLRENGEEKAARILKEFENELLATTGSNKKPEETDITVRFKYFLLLGRKAL
ncbi:putative methyltransferase DDB_G0268948 isoform X1 [Hetaerina americana]|uniref:putative methyltransferase DDB_G0268948 isoform X1 n=1 Tax=Hetaerina americana TaxID=62018 RepID=UPI003A7F5889